MVLILHTEKEWGGMAQKWGMPLESQDTGINPSGSIWQCLLLAKQRAV